MYLDISRFFALTTMMVYFYANNYQEVDEDDYGGITEILKEGLMTSFATFVVSLKLYLFLYFTLLQSECHFQCLNLLC